MRLGIRWSVGLLLLAACDAKITTPPLIEEEVQSTPITGPCSSVSPTIGAWPLQRLTSDQLQRTVDAILHDTSHAYTERLGSTDEVLNSRLRYFYAASGNAVVAEGLVLAAEEVAEEAMANPQLQAQLACAATDAAGQRLCAKTLVESLGRKLWRRALAPSDVNAMLAVYDLARSGGSHADGLQGALHGLLAAPDFFFLQQPQGTSGAQAKLSGTVLAERLALTLWQEAPDETLLAAAETGALDTAEGFDAQLTRLLADPKANRAFAAFLKHWLSPEKTSSIDFALLSATRQPALYPKFAAPSPTSAGDGVAFTRALDTYLEQNAIVRTSTLADLLLADQLVVNEAVARNLNLPLPAAGTTDVRVSDHARRRGVLGQPALLTAFGRFEASDPVHRGVMLLRQMMCRPLNPPDMMVNTTLPEATQFKTTRDRFVTATKDAACAGCHAQINPLGFSFENFDAVGAFRDQEAGNPVDATATLPILKNGVRAQVDGLAQLSAVLAADPEVRACLGRQFAAWALRRGLTDGEYCSVSKHTLTFAEGPGAFVDLVRGVLTSTSFIQPQLP